MRAMFSPSVSRSPLATALRAGVALAFAFGAGLVTSVTGAGPAAAHAVLVKITPALDAQLTTAPTEVVLEFDEPVSTTFATVVVTTAAGVSRGKPTVVGARVGLTSEHRPGLRRLPSRLPVGERRWAPAVGRVQLYADADLGESGDFGCDPVRIGIHICPGAAFSRAGHAFGLRRSRALGEGWHTRAEGLAERLHSSDRGSRRARDHWLRRTPLGSPTTLTLTGFPANGPLLLASLLVAPLAQLAEQLTLNQRVRGSSP